MNWRRRMEPEFSTKQLERKLLSTNYTACIMCQKTDSDAGPLQKVTNQGYPSLLYAVTNRKDDISYRLDNELQPQCDFLGRNPLWHTQCRAKYTNRKTVDQKRKKVEKPEGTSFEAELNPEPESSRPTKKTRMSIPQPIKHKEECFICRTARTTKGNRSLILSLMTDRMQYGEKQTNLKMKRCYTRFVVLMETSVLI